MTEQAKITAICQECGKQFEYVLKPGFPRKYCFECSEEKKASYQATAGNGNGEKPQKTPEKALVREFHLSPEQVRTNALNAALKMCEIGNHKLEKEQLLEIAANLEKYLWDGI